MQAVRVAIVGLGYWGPQLLRNFSAQKGCTVLYGCDLKEGNLEKMRAQYPTVTYTTDAGRALADPAVDLVIIATPTASHFPLAKQALESGKHVFLEKPMCASVKEAQEIATLAKKHKRLLFVDHTFAFAPAVEKIAELARSGALGKLLYYDSTRINLGLIQKDSSVLWDLAIHDLSILARFADLRSVRSVSAHGHAYVGRHAEIAHLHLQFASGFAAHIAVSWLSPVKIRQTIVAGDRAMVTYDDTQPSEKLRIYDSGVDRGADQGDPLCPIYRSGDVRIPALDRTETLTREATHVLSCVRGQEYPRVSGDEGLQMLRILEAADASLASHATIALP